MRAVKNPEDFCPICGRKLDCRHVCSSQVLAQIDKAAVRDPDAHRGDAFRFPSDAKQLAVGCRMLRRFG